MQTRLTKSFYRNAIVAGSAVAMTVLIPAACTTRPESIPFGTGGAGASDATSTQGPGAVTGGPGAVTGGPGAVTGGPGAVTVGAASGGPGAQQSAGVTSGGGTGAQQASGVGVGGSNAASVGSGGAMPDLCMAFTPPRANVLSPVDSTVPNLLGAMTINDKIALLSGGPVAAMNYTEDFAATGDPALGIPNYEMRDGPRGVHLRSGDSGSQSSTWAVAEARAASFDTALEYLVGTAQGEEMKAFKYELSLAPVLNILRNPQWGRAQEAYGEDPVLVGEMGAAFVSGLQLNAGACPKHYTGNDTEDNRNATTATIDEQTLRENYTRPFEIVVKNSDPVCIMAAYNGVNTGQTCTSNTHLLTDILRTNWGWNGFVLSDWWATKGDGTTNINAGLDLEMSDNQAFKSLSASDSTRVDQAATRILNARAKMGGLSDAFKNSTANPGIVNDTAHNAVNIARRTEEEGAVLLQNNNLLPLGPVATTVGMGKADVKSIIILGPDANLPDPSAVPISTTMATAATPTGLGDQGSSYTVPPHAVSFFNGLKTRAGAGITVTTSANAADASKADVVVIPVVMAHADEGEGYNGGGDRVDLTLSGTHPKHWTTKPASFIKTAAAANPNVIVLLAVGGAVVMEDWMTSAKAIVQTFYPGQEGGTAVAELLFGDINFSGKLPFTVAQNPGDYPAFQNTGTTSTYDYFHGYRKFEHEKKTPRFWFGYGMSYTTYEYSNPQVLCANGITSTGLLSVQVTVKNTGMMAGDEIVQLYIGYPNTAVKRPAKELKAFQRVTLAPGASQVVTLQVVAGDMAYWDTGSNGWVVEKVAHTALIGPSADPTKLLSVPFTIN